MSSSTEARRTDGEGRVRPQTGRLARLGPVTCVALALAACGGALDPQGPEAAGIAGVWWLMLAVGTVIYVGVLVLGWLALRHGRRAEQGDDRPAPRFVGTPLLVGGGVAVPLAVLVWLTATTAVVGPSDAGDDPVHIAVEGRRYWWHVTYPDDDVVTANEIHVPVGRRVEIELTSADVIHSFWVPQLAGKVDLVPGRTNRIVIEADEPGEYEGTCAEYCGLAHAQMRFLVIAQPEEDYADWLEHQRRPAPEPEGELALQGREAFLGGACVYCHRIDGTNATSDYGPDLTHLASRRTLAAGILPNTRGDLAGWIVDPQHLKPGNAMPAMRLEGDQLQALLDYLETLE